MPKGEKLRPKQMDQLPLENFENNRVRTFDLSKILIVSYCKNWSLVGRIYDYGKKGEFLALEQFHSWIFSLYAQTSEFELEIRRMNLICKNKPSGGKE
jgi:hypothetical protein